MMSSNPPTPPELRSKIENIYIERLPNPETGLYDLKSSIDDLEALIESTVLDVIGDIVTGCPHHNIKPSQNCSSGECLVACSINGRLDKQRQKLSQLLGREVKS